MIDTPADFERRLHAIFSRSQRASNPMLGNVNEAEFTAAIHNALGSKIAELRVFGNDVQRLADLEFIAWAGDDVRRLLDFVDGCKHELENIELRRNMERVAADARVARAEAIATERTKALADMAQKMLTLENSYDALQRTHAELNDMILHLHAACKSENMPCPCCGGRIKVPDDDHDVNCRLAPFLMAR